MARFAPPVIEKPKGEVSTVEAYTPQSQLDAQFAVDEQRHQETLAANEKLSAKEAKAKAKADAKAAKEAEKREKNEADREKKRELLDQQARKFDASMRTGLLGRLVYAVDHKNEYYANGVKAISDSLEDLFLGKSIEDKRQELDGKVKSTFRERLRGEEKYKDAPEKADEIKTTPKPRATPRIQEPESPISLPEESEAPQVSVEVPKTELPTKIDVGNDETAVKKQIPLLKQISGSVGSLFSTVKDFVRDYKAGKEEEERAKNASKITSKLSKTVEPVKDLAKKGLSLGTATLAGMVTLMDTVKGVILSTLAGVGKFILKALPIAALAVGLYMSVKDAIGGWFSAENWGVSKISGMVGGLIGGLNSGVSGMFKNAGKWALIGAGIGSFVPVVGTLVGGLVGGLFGGIMGYFGGEKIAKVVDDVSTWAWDKLTAAIGFVKDIFTQLPGKIEQMASDIWNSVTEWVSSTVESIKSNFLSLKDQTLNYIKGLFDPREWFKSSDKKEGLPKIEVKPSGATAAPGTMKGLQDSFDKFIQENVDTTPRARAKEDLTQKMYDQSIQNSVTNNSSSVDQSRTTNSSVVSGSFNKTAVNMIGDPNPRNTEGSAFGTRSLINGGFGNPSRF